MNESDKYNHEASSGDEALDLALSVLPRRRVPSDFQLAATRRFEAAHAARLQRRLVVSAILWFVLSSSMLWLLLLNTGGVRDLLLGAFIEAAGFVESVLTLWSNIPIYSMLLSVVASVLLLFFGALIGKIGALPSRVK
jgi:hypothetical protein